MVSWPDPSRWMFLVAVSLLLVPGSQAVRVLDSTEGLPDRVHAYGMAQVDEDIYLVGGGRDRGFLDEITVLEPDGSAHRTATLPEALKEPAAAAHDGQVYIFGGARSSTGSDVPRTSSDIYRFDPSTGSVDRIHGAQLPHPVSSASALTVGDAIYVLGGLSIQPEADDEIDFVETIVRFDPDTEQITELDAELPTGRAQASAVLHGGDIYYLGGHAEAGEEACGPRQSTCFVSDVLRLDPEADRIGQIGSLPVPVRWSAGVVHEQTIYVLGGCQANCGSHQGTSAIQTVDPSSGQSEQLPVTMPVTGGRNSAVVHEAVAWLPGGVRAGGEDGSSDHARVLRIELGATRPWAPTNVTAQAVPGGIEVDWAPPAYDGGEEVAGYVVERGRDGRSPTRLDSVRDTNFLDTNTTKGERYTYRIRAENAQGLSTSSGETRVRATQAPGAPAATAQGGDEKLVVQWSAPEDTGGLEVADYRVFVYRTDSDPELSRCGEACWGKVSASTRQATIQTVQTDPVENGESYTVRVQARNSHGWGDHSDPIEATAKPVPDAPRNLQATKSQEDGSSVGLSWQGPEDASISAYIVYRGPALDELAQIATTSDTSHTDENVPEGQSIVYAIAARNGGEEGPLSPARSVVFATAPGAVVDLHARWTGSSVEVVWSSPNDTGGDPIQRYEVARTQGAMDPEEDEATIHNTAIQRFQDETPPRGTPLAYHVRAVTSAGEGPWEFRQVRVPLTPDSRRPVAALAAHPTKVDPGQRVVFDASGSDDDEDIVAYNFTFGDGEQTSWRSSPRVMHTYEAPGVYNATVQVRDVSGLEASAQSTIAVGPPPADEEPTGPGTNDTTNDTQGQEDIPTHATLALISLLAAATGARRRAKR